MRSDRQGNYCLCDLFHANSTLLDISHGGVVIFESWHNFSLLTNTCTDMEPFSLVHWHWWPVYVLMQQLGCASGECFYLKHTWWGAVWLAWRYWKSVDEAWNSLLLPYLSPILEIWSSIQWRSFQRAHFLNWEDVKQIIRQWLLFKILQPQNVLA